MYYSISVHWLLSDFTACIPTDSDWNQDHNSYIPGHQNSQLKCSEKIFMHLCICSLKSKKYCLPVRQFWSQYLRMLWYEYSYPPKMPMLNSNFQSVSVRSGTAGTRLRLMLLCKRPQRAALQCSCHLANGRQPLIRHYASAVIGHFSTLRTCEQHIYIVYK